MVFLSSKNIILDRLSRKLNNKRHGLFKVIGLVGTLYRLELSVSMKIYNVFYLNLLSLVPVDLLPR